MNAVIATHSLDYSDAYPQTIIDKNINKARKEHIKLFRIIAKACDNFDSKMAPERKQKKATNCVMLMLQLAGIGSH